MPAHVADGLPGRVTDQRRMAALLNAANVGKRADSRRTWEAIARVLTRHADWGTGAITMSHEAAAAEAGAEAGRRPFSHDTIARFIAAAIAAGVLVCPDGLGGKSSRALGGARNQCPTYFVVDPAAASADTDLRTPPSHVSETVTLSVAKAPYKGPIRPKFANFDPTAVPATLVERRAAAAWLCARLLVGTVPPWRMAAMLTRHFAAGRTPSELLRRVCRRPEGTDHGPLPVGGGRPEALQRSPHGGIPDMLLGIIGWRLNLWRDVPPPPAPAPRRVPAPVPQARTAPRSPSALAELARLGLKAGALR